MLLTREFSEDFFFTFLPNLYSSLDKSLYKKTQKLAD